MPLTLRMAPETSPQQGESSKNDDETITGAEPPEAPQSGAVASSERRSRSKPPVARRCPTCEQTFSGEARFCPFDGDPLTDAPDWNPSTDPLIGKVIDDRYEIIGVIGEGGMGTVYEVRHATLDRRLALKVLRRDIADAEHTARFIQEAKAAAGIGHPNIVAVTDFGEIELDGKAHLKVPYFVMEYLNGISLAALLRSEKTLSPERTAPIILQCAAALAAAHEAGVIHRDLKPDNIFLCRGADREYVKLLDFGVAKMAGVGRLTRAGMVFGTPHYMSPEQASGQSVDPRADIYALGVILYECLAGKVPFEADTYMGVLTKHMFATPEPLEHVVPDARHLGALGPIAMRCLAKNPQERFASMAELAAAIEMAMSDPGKAAAKALPEGKSGELRLRRVDRIEGRIDLPEVPRRSMLLPIGIGLGVAVLGIAVFLGLRGRGGEQGAQGAQGAQEQSAGSSSTSAAELGSSATALTASALPSTQPSQSASAMPPEAISASATPTLEPPKKTEPTAKPTGGHSAEPVRPPSTAKPPKPHGGGDVIDPWGR